MPKRNIWHFSQFTGYVNAYEFIKMDLQLKEMDLSKVALLVKDAIQTYPHEYDIKDYMQSKSTKVETVQGLNCVNCYFDKIWQSDTGETPTCIKEILADDINGKSNYSERKNTTMAAFEGAGGEGVCQCSVSE